MTEQEMLIQMEAKERSHNFCEQARKDLGYTFSTTYGRVIEDKLIDVFKSLIECEMVMNDKIEESERINLALRKRLPGQMLDIIPIIDGPSSQNIYSISIGSIIHNLNITVPKDHDLYLLAVRKDYQGG